MGLLLVERQMVIHGASQDITYRIWVILSNNSEEYAVALEVEEGSNREDRSSFRVFRIRKFSAERSGQEGWTPLSMIPHSFSRSGR